MRVNSFISSIRLSNQKLIIRIIEIIEIAVRNLHNDYKKCWTLTLIFERQTTFSKNLVKTFRPKTFGHSRFEFDKKATASFNGSY